MIRKLAPYLAIVLVAVGSTLGLIAAPRHGQPSQHASYVIIAGAAGLRWDDVNPTDTPTLWRMASQGAIGALAVRSGHTPTCPDDGWLTLGAGNYAQRTFARADDSRCPPSGVQITRPDRIGAFLPDQQTVVRENRDLSWGAQPGALAEAVRCTVAAGPGAAIGAARPYGRVDKYVATLPADPAPLLSSCVLSMVDLGTITGATPATREASARRVDATLARVLAARPEKSLVIVAGLSDTNPPSRLHVAIADGPGFDGGWITSPTTGRSGYLQLIDLAPTALAVLDKPAPTKLFAGQPATRSGARPADLSAAVSRLADADREAGAQGKVTGRFFGILAAMQLVLLVLLVPLIRRARSGGVGHPRPLPRWLLRLVDVALVAAALAIPAALMSDAVPWWRGSHPGLVFAGTILAILAAGTAAVVLLAARWPALGPVGSVCTVAALVVGVDVLTGARLQLNGVAGYSALEGVRYAGMGTVGLGTFTAGALLGAGVLAQRVPRVWRPAVAAAIGGVAVVVVGSQYLGADAGGAVGLIAGACLAAALSTGGWLTFARVAWATLAGVAITLGVALLDLRRPAGDQGSLGRFMDEMRSGAGAVAVHRTGSANVVAILTSPLTLIVIGSALFVAFILMRPWGGLKRLFGISPAVKAGLAGVTVASVLAGIFDAAGLNVAGSAAATVTPMIALASIRVLRRSDVRTPLAAGAPAGTGTPAAVPVAGVPVPASPVPGPPQPVSPAPVPAEPAAPVPAEPAAPGPAAPPAPVAQPVDGSTPPPDPVARTAVAGVPAAPEVAAPVAGAPAAPPAPAAAPVPRWEAPPQGGDQAD